MWSATSQGAVGKNKMPDKWKVSTSDGHDRAIGNEQLEAAIKAAKVLAKALGAPSDEIVVSVSGHANPDHEPAEGQRDEFISVTVSVAARPAPVPEPEVASEEDVEETNG